MQSKIEAVQEESVKKTPPSDIDKEAQAKIDQELFLKSGGYQSKNASMLEFDSEEIKKAL